MTLSSKFHLLSLLESEQDPSNEAVKPPNDLTRDSVVQSVKQSSKQTSNKSHKTPVISLDRSSNDPSDLLDLSSSDDDDSSSSSLNEDPIDKDSQEMLQAMTQTSCCYSHYYCPFLSDCESLSIGSS